MDEAARNVTADARPVSVFVSYAHEDRVRAEQIIAALEGVGCTVWWDGLVDGGTSFAKSIEDALEQASAVLVIWSKNSVASHWVRDEAERGRDRGRLVPVTFDGSSPPMGFRQVQTVDMARWRGGKAGPLWTELMRAVMLAAGASEVPERAARVTAPGPSRRTLILGGGVAAIGAVSGIGAWQAGLFATAAQDNSITVIPFKNLSGDPEQDYLAEGISEEIRIQLARNASLTVMAPTSVTAALKTAADPANVRSLLDAALLLNGSVRYTDGRIKVTAELYDARDGLTLWSDRFDFPYSEVSDVQIRVSNSIIKVISAQLTNASPPNGPAPGGTKNAEAYAAYLRGTAYFRLRSGVASFRSALRQYENAVAQDDEFALAHAELARTLIMITNSYSQPSEFATNLARARKSALRGVALAPDNATVQAVLGFVLMLGFLDFKGAAEPYKRAARLDHGDSNVLNMTSHYLIRVGNSKTSVETAQKLVRLDPLGTAANTVLGFAHYYTRDFSKALSAHLHVREINPESARISWNLGNCFYQLGRFTEARAAFLAETERTFHLTGQALAEFKLGNRVAAQKAIAEINIKLGQTSAYQEGQIFAQWGNPERAMERLQVGLGRLDPGLTLAAVDPMLDPLRKRDDFRRLLSKMGFA